MLSGLPARYRRGRFRSNMETIFRLSSIWLRNYKKLRYLQGRNLKCLFSLEFISSTVKNNLFCATILHLTLPIYHCLGNKSKNKLKRRKPKKILVNIYISKLRLDWSEKNPAKNKTYGFWVACTDFSYFPEKSVLQTLLPLSNHP